MSFNPVQVPPLSFIAGQGQTLQANAISVCTPLKSNPNVVTVPIDWATYGAIVGGAVIIDIDLNAIGYGASIKELRSIYIDNTFSDLDVYAYFPDTQFAVICPANSTVMSPVWTNGLKCILYASGFFNADIPKTTYQFSNVPVATAAVVSTLSILRRSIYNPFLSSLTPAVGELSKTYLNCNMGVFSPNAHHYVLAFGDRGSVGINFQVLNTCTIDGFAAPIYAGITTTATQRLACAVLRCQQNLSGRSNVTIVVNYNMNCFSSCIAVLTTYNVFDGITPFHQIAGNPTPPAVTLLTPENGVAFGLGLGAEAEFPLSIGLPNNITVAFPTAGIAYGFQQTVAAPIILNTGVTGRLQGKSFK